MKINTDRIALFFFGFSILFMAFCYGIVAHKYNLFPYPVMHDAIQVLKEQKDKPHRHLVPVRYNKPGIKVIDRDAVTPGVTLVTTYWPEFNWQPGINLIDIDGNVLHHWGTNPLDIWPDNPYDDAIAGTMHTDYNYVHGSYLFPNGDVLVNIEYLGLARLNACGEVIWKLPYRTHHSITRDQDGNFWISGVRWISADDDRAGKFTGLEAPFGEDTVLKVSPDGEVLQEISVLEALYGGGYQYLFFKYRSITGDVSHLNDVEPLTNDMADKFPMFDAGDLVLSMKHISTVMVMDQGGKIKWLDSQNFNRQHDPDFNDDGWLVIFDNREDGTATGKYLGGSEITAVKPSTGELKSVYSSATESELFFTNAGGKHQLFDNGNRLITEARGGRIFEIDRDGRTIWQWIHQPYNDELVPEVMEGTRYDISTQVISGWQCK